MNPDQHEAFEKRRRALIDQIEGLQGLIGAGGEETNVVNRLADTASELESLELVAAQEIDRRRG